MPDCQRAGRPPGSPPLICTSRRPELDALEAIRKRRSVRSYTDQPVADADIDELCRLALLAPTGGMSQSWGIVVVRDPDTRLKLAEIVISGGAEYFALMRPAAEGTSPEEHKAWGREYAEQVLASYRHVPVWLVGLLVPRHVFPPEEAENERTADMISVGFMMENLMVAARAKGLGTVPTVFHWWALDEMKALLDLPDEVEVPALTPLGYPAEWPKGLPPRLQEIRRPWRSLVHDDRWGNTRADG